MKRSTQAQKAERLNRARALLQRLAHADAAARMIRDYSLSSRQAYRYVEQARRLKKPVAVPPSKVTFTVKVPSNVVQQVRRQAQRTGLSLSEIVSRALQVRRAGG